MTSHRAAMWSSDSVTPSAGRGPVQPGRCAVRPPALPSGNRRCRRNRRASPPGRPMVRNSARVLVFDRLGVDARALASPSSRQACPSALSRLPQAAASAVQLVQEFAVRRAGKETRQAPHSARRGHDLPRSAPARRHPFEYRAHSVISQAFVLFSLCIRSITRQSPHMLRRALASGVANMLWPDKLADHAEYGRRGAHRLAAGSAAKNLASLSTRSARRSFTSRRGVSVIACSGQVLAHRPHCTQLRSRKERRGASAAALSALAGQALVHDMHRRAGVTDGDRAERRASRQFDGFRLCRRVLDQVIDDEFERRPLVGQQPEFGRRATPVRRPGSDFGQPAGTLAINDAQIVAA